MKRHLVLTLLCAALAPTLAAGQISTGSIEGLVRDPDGKALPSATVTVNEIATGRWFSRRTRPAGTLLERSYRERIASGLSRGYQTVEVLDLTVDDLFQVQRAHAGGCPRPLPRCAPELFTPEEFTPEKIEET